MLTTLSGEELAELKQELQHIKEPFSLMEFDEEVDDDTKGKGTQQIYSDVNIFVHVSKSQNNKLLLRTYKSNFFSQVMMVRIL